MASSPRQVTWIAGEIDNKERVLCLEASSPARIRIFMSQARGLYFVQQPFGLTIVGVKMDDEARAVLQRGIQRQRGGAAGLQIALDQLSEHKKAHKIIECVAIHHGFAPAVIRESERSDLAISKARGHAAHELRNRMSLPIRQIALKVGMGHHSLVSYWLSKPYEEVSSVSRRTA